MLDDNMKQTSQNSHNNQKTNNHRVSLTKTSFYSGKLPSPDMMQHYNSIDPSFADRILRMAELEELNCHRIDRYKTTVSIILTIAGMVFAFVALLVIVYLIYFSMTKDNTTAATALTGIIAIVIGLFFWGNPKRK